MPILDRTLLNDLGIDLNDQDLTLLEEHFDTTLRDRVIQEIVEELTPEQAEELAAAQDISDEELLQWLRTNVPEFDAIVSDEVDILLGELAENSESFHSSQSSEEPVDDHF